MPMPRVEIPAPPRPGRRGGLFSVVPVVTDVPGVELETGVWWRDLVPCAPFVDGAHVACTQDFLLYTDEAELNGCAVGESFAPFTVYAAVETSLFDGEAAAEAGAAAVVQANAERLVEGFLWSALDGAASAAGNSPIIVSDAVSVRELIALAEGHLVPDVPGGALIHANRRWVMNGFGVRSGSDGVATTILGTPIVAGAYPFGLGGSQIATAYVTGPVVLRSSAISTFAAVDEQTNKRITVAAQTWITGVSCAPYAVSIEEPSDPNPEPAG